MISKKIHYLCHHLAPFALCYFPIIIHTRFSLLTGYYFITYLQESELLTGRRSYGCLHVAKIKNIYARKIYMQGKNIYMQGKNIYYARNIYICKKIYIYICKENIYMRSLPVYETHGSKNIPTFFRRLLSACECFFVHWCDKMSWLGNILLKLRVRTSCRLHIIRENMYMYIFYIYIIYICVCVLCMYAYVYTNKNS